MGGVIPSWIREGDMLIDRMASENRYDLCVIGAGIAGLNALFVAKQYLPATAKVALVDRHAQAGGMWNATYDYVRLHQPHAMFTAGDIPWTFSRPKSYLPTAQEVKSHLAHCLTVIGREISIEAFWQYEAAQLREIDEDGETLVEISLTPIDADQAHQTISAKQVIDAKGLNIPEIAPLDLSSSLVTSAAPQSLSALSLKDRAAYVVGGGKTGMDTVLQLVEGRFAGPVSLIAGKGTLFTNRDQFFPTGLRRYFNRVSNLKTTIDIAMRFDGSNADEVFEHFRSTYSVGPDDRGEHFLFGIMSESESARIAAQTREIIYDYLNDVVDTADGPEMRFKSGRAKPIDAGSVIVNCSGYVFRSENAEPPLLSPGGKILSISSRASFNFLSSVSAYFLTHLLFTGQLQSVPFYVLDQNALMQKDRKTWQVTGTAQGLLNAILVSQALPLRVFRQFGLDFDRWHPFHKRLAGLVDLQINREKYARHCRRVLDDVAASHDVLCAPLNAPAHVHEK